MKLLKTLRITLLALLVWACLATLRPAVASERDTAGNKLSGATRTTYFMVHFDPSDPYLGRIMAGVAEDQLLRVARDLGYKPSNTEPFPLYVYRTHSEFIKAGGLESREFTVGTAQTENAAISVDASGVFEPVDEVLGHEITHAVISRILGPNIAALPLWLNEGLAK